MAQRPPYHSAPPSRAFSPPISASSPNALSPGSSFPPPPKRQRITPNPQSPPFGSPNVVNLQLPSVGSPPNGFPMNGHHLLPAPVGSMGPPSRPLDRDMEFGQGFDEAIAGTGVNLEEEQANLMNSSQSRETLNSLFSTGANNSNLGMSFGSSFNSSNRTDGLPDISPSLEVFGGSGQDLVEAEEDWRAGSRRQHHLVDLFLEGQDLEKKLNHIAYEQKLKTPKEGLFYATQGRPPQRTQVVAPDGSAEVIDKGQTILSSEKGSPLVPLMTLVSLACRDRLTGLVDRASRLAFERRNFSMGRVPLDWQDVAAVDGAAQTNPIPAGSTQAASTLKRTNSQMSADGNRRPEVIAPNRMAELFRKISEADRKAEEARLAKRAKRKNVAANDSGALSSASTPGPSTPLPVPSEPEKRPTKKAMKAAEAKFTEAQQQKSSNETARLATGSAFKRFGNKKTYSWLQNKTQSPASAAAASNVNINMSLEDDAPRPSNAVVKPAIVRPVKQFGEWNEEAEQQSRGIRLRDVLLVLEGDGKATKALLRAYNQPDEVD